MSQPEARIATRDMSTEARAPVRTIQERPVAVRARTRGRPASSPLEEFEQVYLRNVDVLMGYFARRCRDPHTVADLTSETFVRGMDGFARFDPRRGSDRAWLFDRKSTRLNSSHLGISYAVFCLKKKKKPTR